MSSLNKVILIGRVTRDPELRYTPSGKPVASFTLAVDRNRGQGQERETDFIDCVVWQQSAEFASKYATKGRLVCVEGRLQVRSYETQEGQKRKAYEVVCNDLRLLDRRDSSGGGASYEGGGGHYEAPAPARETVYTNASTDRGAVAPSGGGASSFDDDIPF
jgi:single-strand DNA-binding protein